MRITTKELNKLALSMRLCDEDNPVVYFNYSEGTIYMERKKGDYSPKITMFGTQSYTNCCGQVILHSFNLRWLSDGETRELWFKAFETALESFFSERTTPAQCILPLRYAAELAGPVVLGLLKKYGFVEWGQPFNNPTHNSVLQMYMRPGLFNSTYKNAVDKGVEDLFLYPSKNQPQPTFDYEFDRQWHEKHKTQRIKLTDEQLEAQAAAKKEKLRIAAEKRRATLAAKKAAKLKEVA